MPQGEIWGGGHPGVPDITEDGKGDISGKKPGLAENGKTWKQPE